MEKRALTFCNLALAIATIALSAGLIKTKNSAKHWQEEAAAWEAVADSVAASKCSPNVTEIPPYNPNLGWNAGVNNRPVKAEKRRKKSK